MSEHQHDTNGSPLWLYFQNVISWVQTIFPKYRKEMKGLEWGLFYNEFGNNSYNPSVLEKRITELMADDDVTSKKGIYEYLLSGKREISQYKSIHRYSESNCLCKTKWNMPDMSEVFRTR